MSYLNEYTAESGKRRCKLPLFILNGFIWKWFSSEVYQTPQLILYSRISYSYLLDFLIAPYHLIKWKKTNKTKQQKLPTNKQTEKTPINPKPDDIIMLWQGKQVPWIWHLKKYRLNWQGKTDKKFTLLWTTKCSIRFLIKVCTAWPGPGQELCPCFSFSKGNTYHTCVLPISWLVNMLPGCSVLVVSDLSWLLEERLGIKTAFLSILVSAGTQLLGEMFGSTSPV